VAPSPIIPTSFVPKQPVRSSGRFSKSGGNIFLIAGLFLAFLSILAAVGVFAYKSYLTSVRDSKKVAVEKAEQAIDSVAVEEFIRTRDRLTAAGTLLENHVAASRFFVLLERVTLTNVRFNTLSYTLADDRSASIEMDGVARTFNALAAQSSAFASEREVKRAIFSRIDVDDETNTVSFTLSAELAPSLLAFTAEVAPQEEETLPTEVETETPIEEPVAPTPSL
jgi:hypothetical protein